MSEIIFFESHQNGCETTSPRPPGDTANRRNAVCFSKRERRLTRSIITVPATSVTPPAINPAVANL